MANVDGPVIDLAPDASDDALIGAQVGEYVIERRLGEGGMGVVFAGMQPVIRKPVAIKVLQWEIARNPAEVDRLLAEARVVNAIRHRGIVDVISFGKLPDGRPYLVMELLDGEPLDVVVTRRAPMAPVEVVDILAEVLEALGAAHEAGVIHRDLKPSNVFFVRPAYGAPYLKLLDFGLAKQAPQGARLTPQTRASIVIGTPDYMAPEQARGKSISPETDLYAVGCMAFEMLTGRPPFEAPTVYEILTHHLNTPPPRLRSLLPDLPEPLDELVDRLLRKQPEERPSSAAEVRRQLLEIRAVAAAAPPPARAAGSSARTSRRIEVEMAETLLAPSGAAPAPAPHVTAEPGVDTPRVAPTLAETRGSSHRISTRATVLAALLVVAIAIGGVLAWNATRSATPALRATPLPATASPVVPPTVPPSFVPAAPPRSPDATSAPPEAIATVVTPPAATPSVAAPTTPSDPGSPAAPPEPTKRAQRPPRAPAAGQSPGHPPATAPPPAPPPEAPPPRAEPPGAPAIVAQIEARLRALREAKRTGGAVDTLAVQLLRDLRNRAASAQTPEDRQSVARDLREWLARYGGSRP